MRPLPWLLMFAACTDRGTLLNDTDGDTAPRDPVNSVRLERVNAVPIDHADARWQVGDLDSDGAQDLVLVHPDGAIGWIRGGDPDDVQQHTLLSASQARRALASHLRLDPDAISEVGVTWSEVADLDGDGFDDVVQTLRLTTSDGPRELTGAVMAPALVAGWRTLIERPTPLRCDVISDVDGDDRPELVCFGEASAVFTSGGAEWPLPGDVGWIWYAQAGVFDTAEGPLLAVLVNGGFGVSAVERYRVGPQGVEHLEPLGDLYASEAVFERGSDRPSHSALLFNGSELFRLHPDHLASELSTERHLGLPTFGDFDGDGDLDLLAVNYTDRTVQVHASSAPGPLAAVPTAAPDDLLDAERTSLDFNGDGLDDMVGRWWSPSGDAPTLVLWLHRGEL